MVLSGDQITLWNVPRWLAKLGLPGGGSVPASRQINTQAPLIGGGDLSADRLLILPQSSAGADGYLSAGDFAAFAAKENVLTFTPPVTRVGNVVSWTGDTDDVPEASNLYWTAARFNAAFAGKTTADLAESGNLYFTDTRARAALSVLAAPLAYNNSTGVFSLPAAASGQAGYLTAADWASFTAKEAALTFSAPLARATNTISIPVATSGANGYLSSADWSTFNGKVGTARSIATTSPLTGGGDLSADRTFALDFTTAWTWTANGIAATPTDRLILSNTTAAAAGAQQYSPALRLIGQGWGTTAGTSQACDWRIYNQPVQSTVPTSNLLVDFSVAGGAFATKYTFASSGVFSATQVQGASSVASPAYSFTAAPTTGIGYENANFPIEFIIGGVRKALFNTSVTIPSLSFTSTHFLGWCPGSPDSTTIDTFMGRESAAVFQLGADGSSPVAQTLKGADARAGTDTNAAGGNLTLAAGRNTGNAAGGSLLFQTAPAGSSGTGAGTLTTRLTIDSTGLSTFGDAIKTAAPSGGTAAAWKFGSKITAAITVDLTKYVELDVGGTLVKLVTAT